MTVFLGVVLTVHLSMNGKVGAVIGNPRVGNALFSVATVVVVVAGVWPLTTTGVVLVLGTGVYTLVMAELQYQGVRRISR